MKYLFTIVLCTVISSALAQNTINGLITNNETNEALEFVSVYIPQLEKGTTTDENGTFSLTEIPQGTQTLIISIIGFETVSKKITVPTTETLTVQLNPSAIEMEELIISTPFHKLQSENVMKVEREALSELQRQGAVTLSDGLTSIAGVESVSTGVSIGKPVIRGLSANRVLVYTQGIRLENQQFGDEHGLGINSAGIESVEVIKGPASLLYGSDALGGVLYFNPEKYALKNTSEGEIGGNYYSNTQGYNSSAAFKASAEKVKFLFRAGLSEHSDYDTEDYRVTNTRFREQDFKASIGYQTIGFNTDFRYNVNRSKLGIPEAIGEQSTARTPLLPYQDLTNHIFSLKSKVFLNNSSFDVNLGFTYNNRKEFEEHHDHEEDAEETAEMHEEEEISEAALQMKLKTASYDVKYNLPTLGKFETIVGVQGMHQVNTNYGEETLIPRCNY
ncbi:TonB-dependent receptor [Lacinutrix neustonica]|uniref:TonB-dependent receptor n=1 Tax=Lacinutrix neustonica TaxID=2980107 RepID=UPI0028BF1081|nr:carboxypeptidase-like regulatory domain-containing protein [Lacinutrix neustonica]